MRILLVNKFHYRKGGAETYYLTVGSELERMGHEVAYFSMRHPDNLPCEWDKYFVTQREYNNVKDPLKAARDGMALIYSPEAKRNFQALCEEFRPDVVHLNNVHRQITLSILDAPYLRESRVPVFYKQIMLKSEHAFKNIRFAGFERAPLALYGPLAGERDEAAREQYRQLLAENPFEGIRIVDIIREGMTGDDPRLQ